MNTKRIPIEDRFWSKVQVSDGCWLWVASINKDGYGKLSLPGDNAGWILAHRYSWELHHGKIPDGLLVLHECDIPRCVRPEHLFLGSHQDNMDDQKSKSRQARGEKNPMASITTEIAQRMRDMRSSGVRVAKISEHFGVNHQLVSKVTLGQRWKDI